MKNKKSVFCLVIISVLILTSSAQSHNSQNKKAMMPMDFIIMKSLPNHLNQCLL